MSQLWTEIHTRARNHNGSDDSLFLNTWANKIPNFEAGCKCRSFYTLWKQQHPVDFTKYFEWTVNLHNAVNTKLHKHQMSLNDALKRW